MSVINRMLSDLERRGAPSPQAGEQEMRAAAPQRRRRRLSPRAGLGALAVVLVVLAVALWAQRGDRIMAMVPPLAGSEPPAADPAAGEAPAVPELVGVSFDRQGADHRLELRVDGAMDRSPRFSRSGGGATLVVDARADDLVLPAPPPGQDVFRGIAIGSDAAPRTRIRLEIDPAAQLALQVDGRRIALVGRAPEPEAAQDEPAANETLASAAETAAAAPDTADADSAVPDSPEEEESGGQAAVEDKGPEDDAPAAAATADGGTAAGARAATESSPAAAGQDAPEETRSTEPVKTAESAGAAAGGANAAGKGEVRKSRETSPETRARRRYREGREAIARGELATARRALTRAVELDPSLHAARDLLVGLLRRAGETVAARRLLAEGVERSPGRVEYAMPYARLLVDTGDLDRAAAVLEGARGNGAGAPGYHALVAAVAQRRGEHRAAASEYTHALEAEPGNGLWWLGLGVSLAALDKPGEARAAFREARTTGTLSDSLDRWVQGRIEELGTGNEG